MTEEPSDMFTTRVRAILTTAVGALDPQDRAERIAWCVENNQHGVRMFPGTDGVLEFRWGGRKLAMVRAADLDSDTPLQAGFVTEVPDTVPDDWGRENGSSA